MEKITIYWGYDDSMWWKQFREISRNYLENDEYRMICEIHARLFQHEVNYPCKCSPKVIQLYIDEINELYLTL